MADDEIATPRTIYEARALVADLVAEWRVEGVLELLQMVCYQRRDAALRTGDWNNAAEWALIAGTLSKIGTYGY